MKMAPPILAVVKPSRRSVLLAGAGLLAAPLGKSAAPAAAEEPGLQMFAAKRGLVFGAAVRGDVLRKDMRYRDAVLRECGLIVPESEMKWGVTEKVRGKPDYEFADWLADFAARNNLALRGHTAVWWNNLPSWVKDDLVAKEGISLLRNHVRDEVAHFGGRVLNWDVVNEAIEPKDSREDGLRQSVFLKAYGPDYIAQSFSAAREAAPKAALYYNEYGLEYAGTLEDKRREATLRLLSDLKARKVPIDGLGIQSHLKVGNRLDEKRFRSFLAAIADLGLAILISEFDVSDVRLDADEKSRDAAVADHAGAYLEIALDEPRVKGLICWGLTDRYSWLNNGPWARADKLPNRALPLDADMNRKPLWHRIAQALQAAPERPR